MNLIRPHTDNTKANESSLKLCMCANTISPAACEEMTGRSAVRSSLTCL